MASRSPSTIRDQLTFYHSMPGGDSALQLTDVSISSHSQNVKDRTAIGLHIIVDDKESGHKLHGVTAAPAGTMRSSRTGDLPAQKVSKLTVICDTLTIRCRWWLPECSVTIFARRIEFEGDGCIDTSPAPWEMPNAQDSTGRTIGANGADGRRGGEVRAYVEDIAVPQNSRARRIITDGGNGQGGGRGQKGADGKSASGSLHWIGDFYLDLDYYTDSGIKTSIEVILDKHKGKKILGIRRIWKLAEIITVSNTVEGTTEPAKDGAAAVAPGDAGDGASAGKFVTNQRKLVTLWSGKPGKAGRRAPTAEGGKGGWPNESVFYECTYYHEIHLWGSDDNSKSAKIKTTNYSTKDGASFDGKPGKDGDPVVEDLNETEANVWLHPTLVPLIQDYVRSAYLGDDRDEAKRLVDIYSEVFLEPMPTGQQIWTQKDTAYWRALQTEFATLSQRLASHLDYFGKPAGYTPMLSLSTSFQLYRMEVDMALEVLMFSAWINAKQVQQVQSAETAKAASHLILKDSAQIADRIQEAQTRVEKLKQDVLDLEKAQNAVQSTLDKERTRLYNQASGDLARIGQIKFAVNLAAALCQVIPYGQPILGGIASMGADAADLLDKEPDEVMKNLKTRLGDTATAYKSMQKDTADVVKKAKAEAKELAAANDKNLKVEQLKQLSKSKPSTWSTVGKGLAPAATHLKKAYESVQLPQSEIEARLAKLGAQDETWMALSKQIRDLIEQRAAVHGTMVDLGQQVGQGYADLASNLESLAALNDDEASARTQMLGTNTARVIEAMRNRAQLALTEALYNVVRAFESSLFRPVSVNWSLARLADQINGLISKQPMHQWTDSDVRDRLATLKTLFQANLREIRASLIKDLRALMLNDRNVDFEIDEKYHKAVLADINDGLSAEIDTRRLGVIEPDWQRQMMADLTLKRIVFDQGVALPKQGDAEIIVEISDLGIVRADNALFGLRLASPIVKSFRYHFATGKIEKGKESDFSKDLMKLILDDADDKIRQKLTMPAAWTNLSFRATFSMRGDDIAPTIERLEFTMKISALSALPQLVLDVRSSDGFSGVTVDGQRCAELYRVFDRKGDRVTLVADPEPADGMKFKQWEIRRGKERQTTTERELQLEIRSHTRVEAQFVPV
jgi:hypothetical protein